ncbi:MAG: aminotransferase class I/II-fold pyridoxal phosphate-dependent enzyme [Helicobacteraceae bacterium]|nr:aminotransferase class I/II-fold pyridoxal phosphate-dependent enzyme [Helicobacteraceae bacterium]
MKIPFYRAKIDSDEKDNINDLLNGEFDNCIEELEDEFSSYVGSKYALATAHGTSALHLSLLALELKRGDKVLCSVNSYPAVPEVVRHFDAEPIFIDVDEDSFNINLDKLEAYLMDNNSRKLKAVIASHIAGNPIDLTRLYSIASIYNIKVIEDASDALGASYNGEKIGSLKADATCFSFMPHLKKSICGGGMLVTDDEALYNRAKSLRNHAITVNDSDLEYIYDVNDIGNKYGMSELSGVFILAQLKKQEDALSRHKEIASVYDKALEGVAHISIPINYSDHSYSNYIVKIDKNRDSFARELLKKGIKCGLHYIPLNFLSYYKEKYSLKINDFPVALKNYQQVLSLPIFADMSDEEVKYVCKSLKEVSKTRV